MERIKVYSLAFNTTNEKQIRLNVLFNISLPLCCYFRSLESCKILYKLFIYPLAQSDKLTYRQTSLIPTAVLNKPSQTIKINKLEITRKIKIKRLIFKLKKKLS